MHPVHGGKPDSTRCNVRSAQWNRIVTSFWHYNEHLAEEWQSRGVQSQPAFLRSCPDARGILFNRWRQERMMKINTVNSLFCRGKNDEDFQRALPTFSPFMGLLSPSLRPGTIITTTISLDCVSSLQWRAMVPVSCEYATDSVYWASWNTQPRWTRMDEWSRAFCASANLQHNPAATRLCYNTSSIDGGHIHRQVLHYRCNISSGLGFRVSLQLRKNHRMTRASTPQA